MQAAGRTFQSETDSEVVAHLIDHQLEQGKSPQEAVAAVLPRLHGAFAITILFRDHPDMLIGARMGAPLTVGYGDGETYLGSDALALAGLTQRIAYLDEGDWAVISHDGARIFNRANEPVEREIVASGRLRRGRRQGQSRPFHAEGDIRAADRGRPDPLLLSPPVRAQGGAAGDGRRISPTCRGSPSSPAEPASTPEWSPNIGSSNSPGCPVELDIASEFRYRQPVLEPGGLALFISQSGETADTLAALRHARAEGQRIAVVVNVPTSSMAREADLLLPTHAGPGDRGRLDQGLHLPARRPRRARRQVRPRQGPDQRGGGARDRRPSRRGAGGDERRARP